MILEHERRQYAVERGTLAVRDYTVSTFRSSACLVVRTLVRRRRSDGHFTSLAEHDRSPVTRCAAVVDALKAAPVAKRERLESVGPPERRLVKFGSPQAIT